jgi:hypothetical protein
MPSQIDFAIAVGLFFSFISVMIVYLINYVTNYTNLSSTSELRTVAYNIYTTLFAGKGVPRNWTEAGDRPFKVGLVTDMYRIPVIVIENSSTYRGNVSLNLSLTFDANCEKRAWNTTVRVINSTNHEVPLQLFNQTFCSQQFLNTSDIVFNNSFSASETKNFSIYFSNDKNITGLNYSIAFPSVVNFTFTIYPEEKLTAVSAERLIALRKLNYTDVLNTLSKDYYFNLEISE